MKSPTIAVLDARWKNATSSMANEQRNTAWPIAVTHSASGSSPSSPSKWIPGLLCERLGGTYASASDLARRRGGNGVPCLPPQIYRTWEYVPGSGRAQLIGGSAEMIAALLGIAVPLSLGAASPGPSFLMVARTAAAHGRGHALRAALGMGLGGLLFALAALVGLNAVFRAVPALYIAFKVLGGAYLCFLGLRIWRGASRPLEDGAAYGAVERSRSSFLLGLTTQISNPKNRCCLCGRLRSVHASCPHYAIRHGSRCNGVSHRSLLVCVGGHHIGRAGPTNRVPAVEEAD